MGVGRITPWVLAAGCSFTPGKLPGAALDDARVDVSDGGAVDMVIDVPSGPGVVTFGERASANHRNVTTDSYMESAVPTSAAGGLALGIWGDASPTTNGLLRFDLSALPPGTPVTAVELHVATNVDSLESGMMQFYAVLESWQEATVTWNERTTGVAWTNAGVSGPTSRGTQLLGEVAPNVDFTAYVLAIHVPTVQGWIDDPATNHGMVMISTSPSGNGGMFSSREDVDAVRPQLKITYGD